jgi:hypothetical protein
MKIAQMVKLLTYIREVVRSNLSQDNVNPD